MGGIYQLITGASGPQWTQPSFTNFPGGQITSQSFASFVTDLDTPTSSLTFTRVGTWPSWAILVGSSIQVDGTVAPVGVVSGLQISASDGTNTSVSQSFGITVVKATNRPPFWTNPGTIGLFPTASTPATYDLRSTSGDLDGDTLSYQITPPLTLPNGYSLSIAGILTVTTAAAAGSQGLQFRAWDGGAVSQGASTDSPVITFNVTLAGTLGFTLVHGATQTNFAGTTAGRDAALAAAVAGDTLLCNPGNYPFSLGVTKAITVQTNPLPVNAMAPDTAFATFTLLSDSVQQANPYTLTFKGLRVYGAKIYGVDPTAPGNFGISVGGKRNHVIVDGCVMDECGVGLVSSGQSDIDVLSCVIRNCGAVTGGASAKHGIYTGIATSGGTQVYAYTLIVRGCVFEYTYSWYNVPAALANDQYGGHWRCPNDHLIKSDAAILKVQANKMIRGGTNKHPYSTASSAVQGDFGGQWEITGNIVQEQFYSGWDPTNPNTGVKPPASNVYQAVPPGQSGAPPTSVNQNNRIFDYAVQANGNPQGAFGIPWTTQSILIAQNTIINEGWESEKILDHTYNTGYTDPGSPLFGGNFPVEVCRNNVIITGTRGIKDVTVTPKFWATDGSNTILNGAPTNHCVDAPNENYALNSPVTGSAADAPYEFVEPVGYRARADTTRGAYSNTLPDWYTAQPALNTWIPIPTSGFRASVLTHFPGFGSDYPQWQTGGPNNPYAPYPDFDSQFVTPVPQLAPSNTHPADGIWGVFRSDSGVWHSPKYGMIGAGPSGGHAKTTGQPSMYFIYRRNTAELRGWRVWKPWVKYKDINCGNNCTDPGSVSPGWPAGTYGWAAHNDKSPPSGQINRIAFVDRIDCVFGTTGTVWTGGGGGWPFRLGPFVPPDPDFLTNPPSYATPPSDYTEIVIVQPPASNAGQWTQASGFVTQDPNAWCDFSVGEGAWISLDQDTGTFYFVQSDPTYGNKIWKWSINGPSEPRVSRTQIGTVAAGMGGTNSFGFAGTCVDTKRRKIICLGNTNNQVSGQNRPFVAFYIDLDEQPNCTLRAITLGGPDAGVEQTGNGIAGTGIKGTKYTPALEFVPDLPGGDFYALYSEQTHSSGTATPPDAKGSWYKVMPPTQTYDLTAWTTQPWVVTKQTPVNGATSSDGLPGVAPKPSNGTGGGKMRYDKIMKALIIMSDEMDPGDTVSQADAYARAIRLA